MHCHLLRHSEPRPTYCRPQVNLLSKLDLVEAYGPLAFNLDFYTDVPDPSRLLPYMHEAAWDDGDGGSSDGDKARGIGSGGGGGSSGGGVGHPRGGRLAGGPGSAGARGLSAFAAKHMRLSEAICELIDDFGLVGFGAIAISDSETVARALRAIDKANGYCFGGRETGTAELFGCAAGETEWDDERFGTLQERFISGSLGGEDGGEEDGDECEGGGAGGRRRPVEERHMTETDLREELLPPGHPSRRRTHRPVDLESVTEDGEDGTLV